MLLIHLSDLHLSRYGETDTWSQREDDLEGWRPLHSWKRWVIEGRRDKKNRPERIRLVDPEGVVHKERGWPKDDDKAITNLLSVAMERHKTSTEVLIHNRPTPHDLLSLLRVDPDNTNLLFLRLLDQILPLSPEIIVITGDMTDNGFGYGLIEHYLKPWIDRGRLFVIPGNHDTYDMIPRKGRRARIAEKARRYDAFAKHVGNVPEECGAYVRFIDDMAFVGLNSCSPPATLISASGEVSSDQLQWLASISGRKEFRDARVRIGMVHHHLLRMPFELGKRNPIELGMKLRNAVEVLTACTESGIDFMLNGHRHHGYLVQLPNYATVVSSPSSTWGCKSAYRKYVWMIDLGSRRPFPTLYPLAKDFPSTRLVEKPPEEEYVNNGTVLD